MFKIILSSAIAISSFAAVPSLDHTRMDQMNLKDDFSLSTKSPWMVTKIPQPQYRAPLNYRLDLTFKTMDRKRFNFYNSRYSGLYNQAYFPEKTYKADNIVPAFLVRGDVKGVFKNSSSATLQNVIHWIEWKSGNTNTSLSQFSGDYTDLQKRDLFLNIIKSYTKELEVTMNPKIGDILVISATDQIDSIQSVQASYVYMGYGIVLESSRLGQKVQSRFLYLKDVQNYFQSAYTDSKIRFHRPLQKKQFDLRDYLNDSRQQDLGLERIPHKTQPVI